MSERAVPSELDLLIVGAGPAGLAAAVEARRSGLEVLVAERESEPGGIPRHTHHAGYGLRDLHRLTTGPRYARAYAAAAVAAGASLALDTTVLGFTDAPAASGAAAVATLYDGRGEYELRPRAVLLATGTRERPRAARLVPGDRPGGVMTTGALQQLVAAGRFRGRLAVVVGAEHVSFSAVLTLAHAGCRTAAIVTSAPRHQTAAPLAWATAGLRGVPVLTRTGIAAIHGRGRVEAVELTDGRRLACDVVVFTGGWVPDHELGRRAGFVIDPGTLGPQADTSLRLDRPGWFAAGNLLHGAETADVCALDGRHAARAIVDHVTAVRAGRRLGREPGRPDGYRLVVTQPLRWISPQRVRPGDHPPRDRFLLRIFGAVDGAAPHRPTRPASASGHEVRGRPRIEVSLDGRPVWSGPLRGVPAPNRSCWIPAGWVDRLPAVGSGAAGELRVALG